MTNDEHTSPTWPNDQHQLEVPCLDSILEGISFWSRNTPQAPALLYPREPTSQAFETVTWNEFEHARDLASQWLQKTVGLPPLVQKHVDEAENEPSAERTVTLLLAPSHDNMCVWMALANMGYSTQFISPAHVPEVIADLITRAKSRAVVYGGLDTAWLEESREKLAASGHRPEWHPLPNGMSLNGLLDRVRRGEKCTAESPSATPRATPHPLPFVVLHSFGSTSNPKLYPLKLESANLSAKDAATWWIKTPHNARWRCQLQTSLPFHFSFQNPVWRMLMCGTALAFPVIRANADTNAKAASKGGVTLVPGPSDVLDSLHLAKADVLYASPTGLTNMVLAAAESNRADWKDALKTLKEAHTGGAPTSFQMADVFTEHNLMVMQVFATTEAGMLFVGKPTLTGHLCHLTPRPQLKDLLLFHQPDKQNDTLELWLPETFPGLQKHGLCFTSFPGNPAIKAWNTSDTFARIPGSSDKAPLFTFRGRTDDWLRLTSGTACRALEIESRFAEVFREEAISSSRKNSGSSSGRVSLMTTSTGSHDNNDLDSASLASPITSIASSVLDGSKTMSASTDFGNKGLSGGTSRIRHVSAIGNAQKTLAAVVQLEGCAEPTAAEVEAAHTAADIVTAEQLQYPAVLHPEAVVFATEDKPLNITQKGSLQRKKNEEQFAPVLKDRGVF